MVTRSNRPRRRRRRDDSGLSLAEFVVGSGILVIVLPFAGALLHGAVLTQRDVRAVTDAGTAAQVVVASVESGVRNAAALRRSTTGAQGTDELLVARTRGAGWGVWECRAWFYDSAAGRLLTRTSPTAIAAPDAASITQWTTLAEHVVPATAGAPLTSLTAQSRVDLAFVVETGTDRKPVLISTSIVRRPQGDTKGAPCF